VVACLAYELESTIKRSCFTSASVDTTEAPNMMGISKFNGYKWGWDFKTGYPRIDNANMMYGVLPNKKTS
jgi:hypothetical protein